MNRFKVPEEKRHTVPAASANGAVSQIEQSLQVLEDTQPGENGNVDPELDTIMIGMPEVFDAEAAGDLTADIQFDKE